MTTHGRTDARQSTSAAASAFVKRFRTTRILELFRFRAAERDAHFPPFPASPGGRTFGGSHGGRSGRREREREQQQQRCTAPTLSHLASIGRLTEADWRWTAESLPFVVEDDERRRDGSADRTGNGHREPTAQLRQVVTDPVSNVRSRTIRRRLETSRPIRRR